MTATERTHKRRRKHGLEAKAEEFSAFAAQPFNTLVAKQLEALRETVPQADLIGLREPDQSERPRPRLR